MEYLIIFIYVLGVILSPYFIEYMNKITETNEGDEVWVTLFFPWIWPIILIIGIVVLVLWSPALLKDFLRGKFNGK